MNFKIKKISNFFMFLMVFQASINSIVSQNKSIEINGKLVDKTPIGIPYAAISIPAKSIGTSTNEDGDFLLTLPDKHVSDTLEISSIGFKTVKIKIQDFLNRKDKTIILEGDVAALDEVTLTAPVFYVKNALKNLKNNTISSPHQLNILYRRFSVEDSKARFFVEHYLKAKDRGPNSPSFDDIEILEGRKSADYRFVGNKQNKHAVGIMNRCNALRQGIGTKQYDWSKIGDTTYDGEDVIIIEGKKGKWPALKLYIGMDTYKVYKIENNALNSVYLYKKNSEGKLYLSYHNREYKSTKKISPETQKILGKSKPQVKVAYRHEMFVLGLETDKKKIKVRGNGNLYKDIGDVEIPYDSLFWKNFATPPPTAFHIKNIREIESIYGVPIRTQFKMVN